MDAPVSPKKTGWADSSAKRRMASMDLERHSALCIHLSKSGLYPHCLRHMYKAKPCPSLVLCIGFPSRPTKNQKDFLIYDGSHEKSGKSKELGRQVLTKYGGSMIRTLKVL